MKAIYYHPGEKVSESDCSSGSKIRPALMLRALKAAVDEVFVIDGDCASRRSRIRELKLKINSGDSYQFMYVENSNKPNSLTGKFPYIQNIFLEFFFFKFLKQHQIKIGLFYRDIYWRFDVFKTMLPWYFRYLVLPFYYLDLVVYKYTIHHLFLPSLDMSGFFPIKIGHKYSALPPGIAKDSSHKLISYNKSTLNLLYVGGVSPPLYDLKLLFEVVGRCSSVKLVVCCRENEWIRWQAYYGKTKNIRIVHLMGEGLKTLYRDSDAFMIYRNKHEYLDFCMPIKLFEALGFSLPIISNVGTKVAKFVADNSIGWLVDEGDELKRVLDFLARNRSELNKKSDAIQRSVNSNSWEKRVDEVMKILS